MLLFVGSLSLIVFRSLIARDEVRKSTGNLIRHVRHAHKHIKLSESDTHKETTQPEINLALEKCKEVNQSRLRSWVVYRIVLELT